MRLCVCEVLVSYSNINHCNLWNNSWREAGMVILLIFSLYYMELSKYITASYKIQKIETPKLRASLTGRALYFAVSLLTLFLKLSFLFR